jgi:hypothetical protein
MPSLPPQPSVRSTRSPRTSERNELSDGRFGWARLKAHHEADVESLSQPLERCDARPVLAGLDARDGGVARAHPLGELFLREAESGSAHDHEPSDALVRRETLLGRPVLGVSPTAAPRSLSGRRSDRAWSARTHGCSLPILIRNATYGASCPAARGGTRLSASMRVLKSAQRCFAISISRGGSRPVSFRNM